MTDSPVKNSIRTNNVLNIDESILSYNFTKKLNNEYGFWGQCILE